MAKVKQFFFVFFVLLPLALTECTTDLKDSKNKVVAKTKKSELLTEDLIAIIGKPQNELDSIKKAQQAINQWASKEILYQQAQDYFDKIQIKEIEDAVNDYRRELLISKYKDIIIQNKLDTLVTDIEKQNYYDQALNSLKIDHTLLRYRYLSFQKDSPIKNETIKRFRRFNEEDRTFLDSIAILNFPHVQLNDRRWIEKNQFLKSINYINQDNFNQYRFPNILFRTSESNLIHLLYISEILQPGAKPPLEYIDNLLERLIINKRKQQIEREFDNEIINQAIQQDLLQIY
ncbi:MAG: hypothetical protein OXC03_04175 [Flavobacteriaceae bacterium]|nr:hypothetical protein [Flavobacteriaceae bacterium]